MNENRNVYIYLISAITIGVVSCKDKNFEQRLLEQERVRDSLENTIEGKTLKIPHNKFETITYEGCEYLIYKEKPDANSAFGFMAHKGNCNNPIHQSAGSKSVTK